MRQTITNYMQVLYELGISKKTIQETKRIFSLTPYLLTALTNPVTELKIKYKIIDEIFPAEIVNFLKVLCKNKEIDSITEILDYFPAYVHDKKEILEATIYCVTVPDEIQQEKIKQYLRERFQKNKIILIIEEKPELIGGFIIQAGSMEIDWSLRGRITRLRDQLVRR